MRSTTEDEIRRRGITEKRTMKTKLRFGLFHLFVAFAVVGVGLAVFTWAARRDDADVMNELIQRGGYYWVWTVDDGDRVEKLKYNGNRYDDAWSLQINELDRLQHLEIRGQRSLHGFSLQQFAALRNLKILDIRDTSVDPDDVQRFKSSLPNCQVLYSYREFNNESDFWKFRDELQADPTWSFDEN